MDPIFPNWTKKREEEERVFRRDFDNALNGTYMKEKEEEFRKKYPDL